MCPAPLHIFADALSLAPFKVEPGRYYMGTSIASVLNTNTVTTPGSCAAVCNINAKCVHFTYATFRTTDLGDAGCYLYDASASIVNGYQYSLTQVTSGTKGK